MLDAGSSELVVRKPGGEVAGYLTFELVSRLLAQDERESVG